MKNKEALGTAKFIKRMEDFNGDARLYELSVPAEYGWDEPAPTTKFVIVSAHTTKDEGPETFIFAADETGRVLSWTQMHGSKSGVLSHEIALRAAGFSVAGSPA